VGFPRVSLGFSELQGSLFVASRLLVHFLLSPLSFL
jgi:hypothetical protein